MPPADLTPIKIPGKNTRDRSKAALQAKKAANRQRGRPLKLTDTLSVKQKPATVATVRRSQKSVRKMRSGRKLSLLERLPTELLQRVFLYSMNLDLPASSPFISRKLSGEAVYVETMIAAFHPTWDKWYGKPGPTRIASDVQTEEARLQTSVLRRRWASLGVILKSHDIWVQRNAQNREFCPIYFTKRDVADDQPVINSTLAEYFEEDFKGFSQFMGMDDNYHPTNDYRCYLSVEPETDIPNSLLLGFWDEDKIRHLYWLVKAGARINWVTSTTGEAALAGFKSAISLGDLRMMNLIAWSGMSSHIDIDLSCWALRNAGGENRVTVINHLFKIGIMWHNFSEVARADNQFARFFETLLEIQMEAKVDKDEEKMDFFNSVCELESVQEEAERRGFKYVSFGTAR